MQEKIQQIPEEFKDPGLGIINTGLKPTILRFLIVSAIGFLIIVLVFFLYGESPDPLKNPIPFLLSIIGFNLISEGNIIINRVLDKKSPWFFKISRRTRKQLGLSFIWTILVCAISFFSLPQNVYKEPNFFMSAVLVFIFGLIFVLIFNSILFLRSFFLNWKKSVLEVEALKQAKIQSDYKVLQNQLNPHFLFNSFSTLISEIHYNPEKAIEFTQKLAEVYRYLLQKKNDMTVPLSEELDFLDDFIFLHKRRMGNTLVVNIDIPKEYLESHIPPLSLQLLIENAIKHNRSSEKNPLVITIKIKNKDFLSVSNNLQLKKTSNSTGTGLKNICQRYKMLTGREIRINQSEEDFCIDIPLLYT
jgi:two-component system LytT family sensor kinase